MPNQNPWTIGGVDGNVPHGDETDSGPRRDNDDHYNDMVD